MTELLTKQVGSPTERVDGPTKVTGAAHYALDHRAPDTVHLAFAQSPIPAGRVVRVSPAPGSASDVVLVLWHGNAPTVAPVEGFEVATAELQVFQDDRISFRGQIIAGVVAETFEGARDAATRLSVQVTAETAALSMSDPRAELVAPETVFGFDPAASAVGNVEAALAGAPVAVDATYTTAANHHNPMEPHSSLVIWTGAGVTIYDSSQSAHAIRTGVAQAFSLDPKSVRVISRFVGGGFGAKGWVLPPLIVAVMAARELSRPVRMAVTRQQMFSLVGYRPPTLQRVRLGASPGGSLVAIDHDVINHTSVLHDYVEPAAVGTRSMYRAEHRRTAHRVARLNVPTPLTMRAPGAAPGAFALESALDELATSCGMDPVALRLANLADVEPESGRPFSSNALGACLLTGSDAFGWEPRPGGARLRERDGKRVGAGVAAAAFPALQMPGSAAIAGSPDGHFEVRIDATDVGTGALTALAQLAADALEAPIGQITMRIGDSDLPEAPASAGSWGTASWGSAILAAADAFIEQLNTLHGGQVPDEGLVVTTTVDFNPKAEEFAMFAFGAQFAEVEIDPATCEIAVPRLTGAFAAGRIVNPLTATSQLRGGMIMGLSMALHEGSELDPVLGHYINQDLASYHIPCAADIGAIDVVFVDDADPHVNRAGIKGVGEIGVVGVAAAIANAIYDATGVRIRELPIRLDALIAEMYPSQGSPR